MSLRIWLFKLGEQISSDPGTPKLSRTALIANELASRGHQVLWWMSTFDHLEKRQRAKNDLCHKVKDGLEIHLIHTPGYQKNVSLARYRDHHIFDQRLKKLISQEAPPNLIFAAYPTIEACAVLAEYARRHNIPIVIDVRDMWPDVFINYLPPMLRWLYPLIFYKNIETARKVFQNAKAVVGITNEFVSWALKYASRPPGEYDRDYPLAYNVDIIDTKAIASGQSYWHEQGIEADDFVICYFGVMSKKISLDAVAEGMKRLSHELPHVKLILCGNGDELSAFHKLFSEQKNVYLPGWVDRPKIAALMELAKVGLAPYKSRSDFLQSIPTKVIEYLAGGIPILTSLGGTSRRLIESNSCGLYYSDANQFASSIRNLVDQSAEREAMGKRARELFLKRFDAKKVYKELCDHLERLV